MGEIFNKEIEKVEKLTKYNQIKASRLLDDMGTAYLSTEFNGLDKSLIAVKTAKKAMRAQGIPQHTIDDYFLERSYLSKSQLRNFCNDSIYTGESVRINPVIERIPAHFTEQTTTDLIISKLKDSPKLLSCLQRNVSKQYLSQKMDVSNPVLLQDFYNKHKNIIND
jgi:hypothetical protein